MIWKKLLSTLAVLTLGFVLGICGKFIYESSVFKPYQWNGLPIIVNCYGSDLSKVQVMQAIDYWTIRGEQIGFYEHNPPNNICKKDNWIYGLIIIRKAKLWEIKNPSTLAQTRRYTSLGDIKGAVITFRPGKQNLELINEHELGHALGYTHIDQIGHVMNPIYQYMGLEF